MWLIPLDHVTYGVTAQFSKIFQGNNLGSGSTDDNLLFLSHCCFYLSISSCLLALVTAAIYLMMILDASVFPEPLSPGKNNRHWNIVIRKNGIMVRISQSKMGSIYRGSKHLSPIIKWKACHLLCLITLYSLQFALCFILPENMIRL